MKFLYLKTKPAVLMSIFILGMAPGSIHAVTVDYTNSIESIYKHFDGIMDNFEQTFKSSFSEKSTEKLNITAKKLKESETVIKQFVAKLKKKAQELRNAGQQSTNLYRFIDILLNVADEIEIYFTQAYNTLTSGLNKKLKATALAKQLSGVIDTILTDKNFKKLNDYLTRLQSIASQQVVKGIDEIRKDINNILAEYKRKKSTQNAAAISMLRRRLPY